MRLRTGDRKNEKTDLTTVQLRTVPHIMIIDIVAISE